METKPIPSGPVDRLVGRHTPGPWTLTTVPTSVGYCHKIGPFPWKEGRQNHACIYADYIGPGPVDGELMANARLIAAAPDLLAALQNLLSWRETGHNGNEPWNWAEAAVAKALGVPPNNPNNPRPER